MANDAAYFRSQAARSQAEADAALLDNVRDRALRSMAAFNDMAESIEKVARRREEREARSELQRDEAEALVGRKEPT